MYIDIGTCICKSISIYVYRDAYIERGFSGEKSQYTKSKAIIGGGGWNMQEGFCGAGMSQAVIGPWFSCPDVKREGKAQFICMVQDSHACPAEKAGCGDS